jgi:hypothetical protein
MRTRLRFGVSVGELDVPRDQAVLQARGDF